MADDAYLAISQIANDTNMVQRMYAATTQQLHLGSAQTGPYTAITWVDVNRYLWASSPGWGEAWDYALAAHPDDPEYEPGKDPGVITDGMILATVQALAGTATAATVSNGNGQAEREEEPA
jgi:hypothetical protein